MKLGIVQDGLKNMMQWNSAGWFREQWSNEISNSAGWFKEHEEILYVVQGGLMNYKLRNSEGWLKDYEGWNSAGGFKEHEAIEKCRCSGQDF